MPGASPVNSTAPAPLTSLYGNNGIPVGQEGGEDYAPSAPAPVTAPVQAPQSSNLINTSSQSRTATNQATSDLAAALARLNGNTTGVSTSTPAGSTTTAAPSTDPILSGLDALQANSDAATKSLIASTQAAYQNKINAVNTQYTNYKSGLQQLGVETNEAQSTPDLLAGHIQQAANDQMDKINALGAEESKALMDANNAKATNDFKTLQAKMTYVQQIQTQKAQAIKDMYDSITSAKTASDDEAEAIYSTMQTLDPSDQEAYLQAVSSKYNLPLDGLVASLNTYKAAQDKAALATQNTESIIAKRATGGSSTKGASTAQIAVGTNILKTGKLSDGTVLGNPQGSDGYVDPSVYSALYSYWNGTNAAFLKAYPITEVNPESYPALPAALQPKTSSRSS